MYDFRVKHYGFKKSEDGNWIYTKTYLTPAYFPIIKRQDKSQRFKIKKENFKEYVSIYKYRDLYAGFITVPSLVIGINYSPLFLLLMPFGIYFSCIEKKKRMNKIFAKAKNEAQELAQGESDV